MPELYKKFIDNRLTIGRFLIISLIPFGVIIVATYYIDEIYVKGKKKCFEKGFYQNSIDVELENEKPVKFINHEGQYFTLDFDNNKRLYSCGFIGDSGSRNNGLVKISKEILNYSIRKEKKSVFFYASKPGEQKVAFKLTWSKD